MPKGRDIKREFMLSGITTFYKNDFADQNLPVKVRVAGRGRAHRPPAGHPVKISTAEFQQ
jgi:hypothetical protein